MPRKAAAEKTATPAAVPEEKTETAMTRAGVDIAPFRPENLSQAARLAQNLAKATMLPKALRGKPADILVVMITAHELGLSPMQGIRGMHVIEGKAVMSAELMSGLVQRDASCVYLRLIESTDQVATYETMRKGHPEPTRLSYTIEQAQKAGLATKDNWKKHPAAMLRARASSGICRAVYGDLVNGVYSHEEAIEIRPVHVQRLEPAPGQGGLDVLAETINTNGRTVDLEPGELPEGTVITKDGTLDELTDELAAKEKHPDGCFCDVCEDRDIPAADPALARGGVKDDDDGQGVLVDI